MLVCKWISLLISVNFCGARCQNWQSKQKLIDYPFLNITFFCHTLFSLVGYYWLMEFLKLLTFWPSRWYSQACDLHSSTQHQHHCVCPVGTSHTPPDTPTFVEIRSSVQWRRKWQSDLWTVVVDTAKLHYYRFGTEYRVCGICCRHDTAGKIRCLYISFCQHIS